MTYRNFEEIKEELDDKLKNGHPGNLQIQLTDKLLLHCADCNYGYDKDGNELVDSINFSFSFYGENIQAALTLDRDDEYFSIGYAEGQLLSSFEDFIEDCDNYELLLYIWDAIANWTL